MKLHILPCALNSVYRLFGLQKSLPRFSEQGLQHVTQKLALTGALAFIFVQQKPQSARQALICRRIGRVPLRKRQKPPCLALGERVFVKRKIERRGFLPSTFLARKKAKRFHNGFRYDERVRILPQYRYF